MPGISPQEALSYATEKHRSDKSKPLLEHESLCQHLRSVPRVQSRPLFEAREGWGGEGVGEGPWKRQ